MFIRSASELAVSSANKTGVTFLIKYVRKFSKLEIPETVRVRNNPLKKFGRRVDVTDVNLETNKVDDNSTRNANDDSETQNHATILLRLQVIFILTDVGRYWALSHQ